jgi:hypothetical protein
MCRHDADACLRRNFPDSWKSNERVITARNPLFEQGRQAQVLFNEFSHGLKLPATFCHSKSLPYMHIF